MTTLRTVFPIIESFGVKGPWDTNQAKAENLLFFAGSPVALTRESLFEDRVRELITHNRLPSEASGLLAARIHQEWPQGQILTDDYAPYDLLVGREVTHGAPPGLRPSGDS